MRNALPHHLLVLALVASCIDPVHTDAVDALGPEAAGVRTGPNHRPGQPCMTCHGGNGPGPDFAVAGTVYEVRNGTAGLPGVTVTLTDATNTSRSLVTNDVGNFYLRAERWAPVYPLHAELHYGDALKKMESRIGRIGGCAECHRGTGDTARMPAVFMRDQ